MVQVIKSKWWLLLLRGLAAIVVGIIAFMQPNAALIALVLVLGAYSFVAGALAFTAALTGFGGDRWWALLFEGILGLVVAFVIWFWPLTSAMAFVYFVAAWFIASGILQIAAGVRLRDYIDNEWLYVLAGVVSIGFGIWVFRSPSQGTVATAYLFGIYFLIYGIMQTALAFRIRSLANDVTKAVHAATT
jgi:uncharacterized membrane protein HdeD (DUF308 family)